MKLRTASVPAILLPLIISLLLEACASSPPHTAMSPSPPAASAPAATLQEPPKAEPQPSLVPGALAVYRSPAQARAPIADEELKVVVSAKSLLGQKPNAKVVVKGKAFTLDCIGTVSASYYGADIDITKDFGKYSGNGVNCLYQTLKDKGVLFGDSYPRPGDVIVWDNTWDANGDEDRTNDPRTHAGLVISVDDDGTIAYLHENMYSGVVIEYMNLLMPAVARDESDKRINSSLAIATKSGGPKPERFLAGDVFNAFGDVLKIAEYLRVAAPSLAWAGE
jgi:hypothetical protein